ncbi:RecB family exonuclease [Paraflavitalea soli]|nr:PD-(D/E)XK nuclease family protein [Paraflavitalea soli]
MLSQHPTLSDMERIGLFTRLIDSFPKGHPLKRYRGDIYHEADRFHLVFGVMKRQGWTSVLINQQIDEHLASLEGPIPVTVTEWTDKLRAAVHEFDNYQVLLGQLNRQDIYDQPEAPDSNGHPFNLLEDPLIEKIILLLNYLAAGQDIPNSGDEMLFELLHGAWFNIPPQEIINLVIEVADRQYTEYITSLRRLLQEKVTAPPKNLFTPAVPEGLKRASGAIEKLIGLAAGTPLPLLLEQLLQETGIRDFISQSPDKEILEQRVNRFTAYITEEACRNPAMDLPLLVKLLSLMSRSARAWSSIEIHHPANALQALAPLYQPAAAPAFTRTGGVAFSPVTIATPTGPQIARLEVALENKLLQRFAMSATTLNNFLRCPLEFYYTILIRIPFPRNEATEFGSAVHWALEMLFRKMQSNQEVFPPKEVFIKEFEGYMRRRRASFTPEQFNRRLAYGQEVLSHYYDEYIHTWSTIVTVERNFRNVMVQGVPLKGKIDKLEFDGRSANLVDYKTGDPDKSRARLAPPGEVIPNGGDYWRQAVFYKILVDNYPQKEWKVTSAEFDFIEPDKNGHYHKVKLFITPEEVNLVTRQIITAWQRIQQRAFYTGCGKPDCHWCHFVKTYELAQTPHE